MFSLYCGFSIKLNSETKRDAAYQDLCVLMRCATWSAYDREVTRFREKYKRDREFVQAFNTYWGGDTWRGKLA